MEQSRKSRQALSGSGQQNVGESPLGRKDEACCLHFDAKEGVPGCA